MQTTSRGYQYPEPLIDPPDGPAQIQQVAQRSNEEWGTVAAVVNLPATDPAKTGRRRYVTTTGDEYVDLGTGWAKTGSVNYAPINAPSFTGNPTVQNTLLFGVAGDTNLYRAQADVLKTDDAFVAAGGFSLGAPLAGPAYQSQQVAAQTVLRNKLLGADANDAFHILGDGKMEWGAGGASAVDTSLRRAGVNTLATGGWLLVTNYIDANTGGASRIILGHNGVTTSASLTFGSALDANLYRSAAGALKTDGVLRAAQFQVDATASTAFRGNQVAANVLLANNLLSADAQNAFRILGNGKMEWGAGGATAVDVNLYRGAADQLKTDDALVVMGQITCGADVLARYSLAGAALIGAAGPASEAGLRLGSAGDTVLYRSAAAALKTDGSFQAGATIATNGGVPIAQVNYVSVATGTQRGFATFLTAADVQTGFPTLRIDSDGKINIGAGGATALDTNLYRSAADSLKTDDTFSSVLNLLARAGAAGQVTAGIGTGIGTGTEAGILLGSAGDTNLYRSAADTLRTSDNLVVDLNLTVTGTVNGQKLLASPYFRAHKTVDSAAAATGGVVIFDTEVDPNGWYNPATGRFQPTVAGRYRVSWSVGALPLGADDRMMSTFLRMNGAGASVSNGTVHFQRGTATSNNKLVSHGSDIVAMNGTTDYLEIIDNHDGDFNMAVNGLAGRTHFEAEYIGA